MRSSMRIAAAIVGGTALVAAVAGVAMATTTTTSPVTLCVAKNGAVTYPSTGSCSSTQTTVHVGSASDVASLAGRMDTVEGRLSSDESTIADLQSQVTALSSRLTTDEQTIAAQGATLDADKVVLDALPRLTVAATAGGFNGYYTYWAMTLNGANLDPGSVITLHSTSNGTQTSSPVGTVSADGTVGVSTQSACSVTDAYWTGVDVAGNPVSSNLVVKGPGCP